MNADTLNKLSTIFVKAVDRYNADFIVREHEVDANLIGRIDGLLPLFLNKANKFYDIATERKEYDKRVSNAMNIEYRLNQDALLEVEPSLTTGEDNIFTYYSHFLLYALDDHMMKYKDPAMRQEGKVPLDSLYDEWIQDLETGLIKVVAPTTTEPQITNKN